MANTYDYKWFILEQSTGWSHDSCIPYEASGYEFVSFTAVTETERGTGEPRITIIMLHRKKH